ncbi:hypothetical protein Enr10x_15810 [Gimesia panareensis]|uniref:Uncharacterized protein n=1 Tax=Gimesia panareensis TaxID=2527978 RepID=A0A517Q3S7_9PLAN|nr:hypothetical protein Enr10x_15810 [Gimesia panareensis]
MTVRLVLRHTRRVQGNHFGHYCSYQVPLSLLLIALAVSGCQTQEDQTAISNLDNEVKQELKTDSEKTKSQRSKASLSAGIGLTNRSKAFLRSQPVTLEAAADNSKRIFRQIMGIDSSAQPMTQEEIEKNLGDLFAMSVLRKGTFPDTVDEITAAINAANPELGQTSYVVGEGSQIKTNIAPRSANRDLRYVIIWPQESAFDLQKSIFLSVAASSGESSFHQVIAWDQNRKVFNFYERARAQNGQPAFWSWAGDSTFSSNPASAGKGCFDCHHNGTLLMKELKRPWENWNSNFANIAAGVVPQAVAQQNLFKDMASAERLEPIIETAILNSVRNRINAPADAKKISEYLKYLTRNTQINFESSQVISSEAGPSRPVKAVPLNFFINDFALRTVLKIDYSAGALNLDGKVYTDYIKTHDFKLVQQGPGGAAYTAPGSTHFAYFTPAPSFFDGASIQRLISRKIITDKFAASLLLVDYPNPIFSMKRRSLEKYLDQVDPAAADFQAEFVEKVRAGTQNQNECDPTQLQNCSPEQQFLFYWDLPDDQWRDEAQKRITKYLSAVVEKFNTTEGAEAYLQLLVSRQKEFMGGNGPQPNANFRNWPLINNLAEFSLLLPETDLSLQRPLEMKADGTVAPK